MSNTTVIFLALTFGLYYGFGRLQKRLGRIWLNPVLLTVISLIVLLELTHTDFDTYREGGKYIEFWLKPAIVALGVPLYRQLGTIRRQWLPIIMSQIVGSAVGIVSVVLIAQWLGASREVVLSLAPKSVTSPIAMEITGVVGGIPSLTAGVVICVGIFGAMFGLKFLRLCGDFPHHAEGLGVGTASHGIGTAQMFTVSPTHGTFATLGLILNGIFTSLLAPVLLGVLKLT